MNRPHFGIEPRLSLRKDGGARRRGPKRAEVFISGIASSPPAISDCSAKFFYEGVGRNRFVNATNACSSPLGS
jgi:hypothetical protein